MQHCMNSYQRKNTIELLVSLKSAINDYFDHTMVMAEDAAIKQNRLNQMAALAQLIKKFANVNEIIVK